MKSKRRLTGLLFGLAAGLASIEHGIFEILQGRTRPEGLMIASMGPPCDPLVEWNACEPAMTIIPDFLITGVLAVIIGIVVTAWALFFLRRRSAGYIMVGLCVLMLLFGGGIFPPVIGMVGGFVAANAFAHAREKPPTGFRRIMAALWPWPLVLFMSWLIGQWVIGYFFNDFLAANAVAIPVIILGLLVLAVVSASAVDRLAEVSEISAKLEK